jgi:hypothetical protein
MRNTFTGYFSGWDRCEDCKLPLHRHGATGLRHPRRGVNGWTGLQIHRYVLDKKAEAERQIRVYPEKAVVNGWAVAVEEVGGCSNCGQPCSPEEPLCWNCECGID